MSDDGRQPEGSDRVAPARAVAIGAPIPGRAFRDVLREALAARGFEAVALKGAEPDGALSLRIASLRDGAGWLLIDAVAGAEDPRGEARQLARGIAERLGAPATIASAQCVNAAAGVLLSLTTIAPDGSETLAERLAERDETAGEDAPALCEAAAIGAVCDGHQGGAAAAERLVLRATVRAGTGNRRLDDIVRAIEGGASYALEDLPDGRVTARIDRGGRAGRQISMLTREEARLLRSALATP